MFQDDRSTFGSAHRLTVLASGFLREEVSVPCVLVSGGSWCAVLKFTSRQSTLASEIYPNATINFPVIVPETFPSRYIGEQLQYIVNC